MISSISDYYNYYKTNNVLSTSSVTSASEALSANNIDTSESASTTRNKEDTLILSVAYKSLSSDDTVQAVQTPPPPPPPPPKAAPAAEDEETDAIDESVSLLLKSIDTESTDESTIDSLTADTTEASLDLTTKSESDLRSLVDDGTIVAELARRERESSEEVTDTGSYKQVQELTNYQKQGIQAYIQQATSPIQTGNVLSIA